VENNVFWHFRNLIRHPFSTQWYVKKILKKYFKRDLIDNKQRDEISKIVELDTWYHKNLFGGMIPNAALNTVDWIVPDFSEHSGGHRTISRMCKGLEMYGISSRFLLLNSSTTSDFAFQTKIIKEVFNLSKFSVVSIKNVQEYSSASIATSWESSIVQTNYPSPEKFYFVQDAEHLFYPSSSESALALSTYSLPTKKIVLGKWLAKQIEHLGTGVDLALDFGITAKNAERVISNSIDPKRIIIYLQPSKPRRGTPLIIQLLHLVGQEFPEYEVLVLGEDFDPTVAFASNITFLGAMSESEMLSRFLPGAIGLVISHSNPSLVPFEMLNRGMSVCTNGEWSNKIDFSEGDIEFFIPLPSQALLALKRAVTKNVKVIEERENHFPNQEWEAIANKFGDYLSKKLPT